MSINCSIGKLEGIKIFEKSKFEDCRGYFTEIYKYDIFSNFGLPLFVQDNLSISNKGAIRGMHWQENPHAQGKLVTCLSGSILDIAVDVRPESPTFGQYESFKLTSENNMSVWIPAGFAHGFQSLEENSIVHYKVDHYWNKDFERAINPIDIYFELPWENLEFIVSEKDKNAPPFGEYFDL